MHIPNGFLDPKISTGAAFAAAGVLGFCIVKVKQMIKAVAPKAVLAGVGNFTSTIRTGFNTASSKLITKMMLIGMLILFVQFFDFPIINGSSGHILGGIIAAVAIGPFAATVVMSGVLFFQALFLSDGGTMVLGANILNMAVVGTFGCYYIYYIINSLIRNKFGYYFGLSVAAFSPVLITALIVSFQINASNIGDLNVVLSPMVSTHLIVGIAEALATIMVLNVLISLKFKLEGKVRKDS